MIVVYSDYQVDIYIEADGDRLRLSARGRLLGNEVFVKFLP